MLDLLAEREQQLLAEQTAGVDDEEAEIKANKLLGNMHQPQRNLPYTV